jgi:hypothetical protein
MVAGSALATLPPGAIRPSGWLLGQLRLQAEGITGPLEDHWPSVGKENCWLGGPTETWETYERGPYYLDGLIPLAFQLEDAALQAKARRWIEWSLQSQRPDGRFGPPSLTHWWPWTPMLKAMAQWHEATGDERVIPFLGSFFTWMGCELHRNRLRSWAAFRWMDAAAVALWLYRRTGDEGLLATGRELMFQGFSWTHHFQEFAPTQKQALNFPMSTHVVNTAMGIKGPGVAYQLTGRREHLQAALAVPEVLDKYHGTAVGIFTGDEHLAGRDPNQGTELCAVVEYMYSLEYMIALTGGATFGDRLERIAYNALPAAFDPLMRAHQYDQQSNQVLCSVARRGWTNNGDWSNVFGLEPNYGCCTADLHQGWPKFLGHLWMRAPDDGLAAVAYGPCVVTTEVRGVQVRVEVDTGYPFEDQVRIHVRAAQPVVFPIRLRVPAWAEGPELLVSGRAVPCEPGGWAEVEREWSDDHVTLALPARVWAESRFRNATTLHRGPLTFSLRIGEDWRPIGGQPPFQDFEVHPETAWNYGLVPDAAARATFERRAPESPVFAPDRAPVTLRAPGRRVPQWVMQGASAGQLPHSPVFSSEPEEMLELVPYGCAKLRVTEFPTLDG